MMRVLNLRTAAIALVAGLGLGGCAYGPYGGLGVGYGNGYSDGYYDPYYGGYGYGYSPYGYSRYGYGQPYYGWNDGFYYPGTGYYVYDRYRNPYRWTDAQRKYWEWRRAGSPQTGGGSFGKIVQNWADFQNGPQGTTATTSAVSRRSVASPDRVRVRRSVQQQRPQFERRVVQQQRAESRDSARSERQAVRAERRAVRVERRERRERRDDD